MNHQLWTFVALDLALQRAEAANHRRASRDLDAVPSSSSRLRRSLANSLAAISRGAAAVVRKLDDCVADDLGRSFVPTE